ncbi:MAG: hypothetical protein ACJA2W_000446 [Planctomycetota bacterium]|jgi:hypothetical protein
MFRRTLPVAATCLAAFSLASVASAQFTESFDSYTAGSAIEGQGNWQNWDICATGNQAFNTVTSAQAASGANSLSMIGSNAAGGACPGCSDTTHELNGPYTSGQWTMTFQTYIPSSFAGLGYFILLSEYGNCGGPYDWSSQIHFDDTGMVIADDLGANTPINGNQLITYDQWVELKVEIDLDLNTVVYSYNDVQMSEGTWSTGGNTTIAALDLFPGSDDTTEYFVDDISLTPGIAGSSVGANYCTANVNSTGIAAEMSGIGSASIANNDLLLMGTNLPNNAFGFFITSDTSGFVAMPGGSSGNLCVLGSIGRYVGPGQIQNSGSNGTIELLIDNTMIPTPTGFVSGSVGETRYFQLWHRDGSPTGPTSNFTDGLAVIFN